MPTADQQSLIGALHLWLEAAPSVQAAWLAGSLGKGGGDQFSDVDLLLLVGDGAHAAVSNSLAAKLDAVVRPVLVNKLFGGRVLNIVTDDWQRFDLSLVEAAELARFNAAELTPLFNRSDHTPPTREEAPYQTPPDALLKLVQEFLRVLGLSVGAMGREEYQLALNGIDLLRRMTMDLMLEENGVSPARRGGALHRNPFLTAEQRAELAALPPLSANRASLIETNGAFAAIFLPRSRRVAAQIGMTWPKDFEAATRRHLERGLGLEI